MLGRWQGVNRSTAEGGEVLCSLPKPLLYLHLTSFHSGVTGISRPRLHVLAIYLLTARTSHFCILRACDNLVHLYSRRNFCATSIVCNRSRFSSCDSLSAPSWSVMGIIRFLAASTTMPSLWPP